MILNGNQRGGAKDLALHLMKDENEHVEVHQLRGFASQNLMGALNEAYAVSRGTRCKQFLYSLSLNPPPNERVDIADFEAAIDRIEERLGLSGQPRAIVFHEKEGRRHCHVVWSRIDIEAMKAVRMSYDHEKLRELSRELFLEHGWKMPRGLVNSEERNPKNFTHEEWQQAKRIGTDPRIIKTAIQDAWAISDSKAAFASALQERGYVLARGDSGRLVAVDIHGEVYAIARQIGIHTKQVRDRLGEMETLPSVEEAKKQIAQNMLPVMRRFREELQAREESGKEATKSELQDLVVRQRSERQAFMDKLAECQKHEALARQARFRTGFKGLWDRLRGEHRRIREENERDYLRSLERDRAEKDQLITAQLGQRRMIRQHALVMSRRLHEQEREIEGDITRFEAMRHTDLPAMRDAFMQASRTHRKRAPRRERSYSREPER